MDDFLIELDEALRDAFNPPAFERFLFFRLKLKVYDIAPQGTFVMVMYAVLKDAYSAGWIRDLIAAACVEVPLNPKVVAFVAKYPEWNPANQPKPIDHYNACRLISNRPFINRLKLRELLKKIDAPNESRVLVVTGDPMSGKTYTSEFIRYLTQNRQNQKAIYVDLDRYTYTPGDLAEELGNKIRGSTLQMPKRFEEQPARWNHQLCNYVTSEVINTSPITWWFIFDGFRQLDTATDDFLHELVLAAEANLARLRIVLLGYGNELPSKVDKYVHREGIETITRRDLIDFLKCLNVDLNLNLSEIDIERFVDDIIGQAKQQAKGNSNALPLPMLSGAVETFMKRLQE